MVYLFELWLAKMSMMRDRAHAFVSYQGLYFWLQYIFVIDVRKCRVPLILT